MASLCISAAPAWDSHPARWLQGKGSPGGFKGTCPNKSRLGKGDLLSVPVGSRASSHLLSLQNPGCSHIESQQPCWALLAMELLAQQPMALISTAPLLPTLHLQPRVLSTFSCVTPGSRSRLAMCCSTWKQGKVRT